MPWIDQGKVGLKALTHCGRCNAPAVIQGDGARRGVCARVKLLQQHRLIVTALFVSVGRCCDPKVHHFNSVHQVPHRALAAPPFRIVSLRAESISPRISQIAHGFPGPVWGFRAILQHVRLGFRSLAGEPNGWETQGGVSSWFRQVG